MVYVNNVNKKLILAQFLQKTIDFFFYLFWQESYNW